MPDSGPIGKEEGGGGWGVGVVVGLAHLCFSMSCKSVHLGGLLSFSY